jgi:hypothetical protein
LSRKETVSCFGSIDLAGSPESELNFLSYKRSRAAGAFPAFSSPPAEIMASEYSYLHEEFMTPEASLLDARITGVLTNAYASSKSMQDYLAIGATTVTMTELLNALRRIESSTTRTIPPPSRRDYTTTHGSVELAIASQFVPAYMLTPLAQYLSPDLEQRSDLEDEDVLEKAKSPNQTTRKQAYDQLKAQAPLAKTAIPAWIKGLEDDERTIRDLSRATLTGFKIHALPDLIQAISKSPSALLLIQVVGLIRKLGRAAHSAVPTLLSKLREQRGRAHCVCLTVSVQLAAIS